MILWHFGHRPLKEIPGILPRPKGTFGFNCFPDIFCLFSLHCSQLGISATRQSCCFISNEKGKGRLSRQLHDACNSGSTAQLMKQMKYVKGVANNEQYDIKYGS